LTLYWQTSETPALDYTVFIHIVDEAGQVVTQGDGPPVGGFWPTSVWGPGQAVTDTHRLTVPKAGTYRVLVGLYDPATVTPLAAFKAEGSEWPDRAVELALLKVK